MNIWIAVLSAITLAYGAYYVIIGILGSLRKRRVIPSARPRKKLAVLIAARNEEGVIGECVASLKAQRYPDRLYDIYVFPNNCTDDTAGAAERAGARVICPDVPIHSKGDVLFFAFERLLSAPEHYDGYLIFDADNIVDEQFLKRANDALLSGVHAAQGYRDSKNPHANWISGVHRFFSGPWMVCTTGLAISWACPPRLMAQEFCSARRRRAPCTGRRILLRKT